MKYIDIHFTSFMKYAAVVDQCPQDCHRLWVFVFYGLFLIHSCKNILFHQSGSNKYFGEIFKLIIRDNRYTICDFYFCNSKI